MSYITNQSGVDFSINISLKVSALLNKSKQVIGYQNSVFFSDCSLLF